MRSATAVFNAASTGERYPNGRSPRACRRLGTSGCWGCARAMIDNFSLGLTHGLMLLAAWLLLRRTDLDREPSPRDAALPPKGKFRGGGDA